MRAGSPAAKEVSKNLKAGVIKLRAQLLQLGVLTDAGDHLQFMQDYAFRSPSTAAKVILGYEANGRTAWKTESGVVLRDIQNAAIES